MCFIATARVTREDNLVVAVTRYTEQKRVDLLIRAFDWVVREEKSARLELYGAGPLEENVRAVIEELGLERQIVMHPPVSQNDLRKVYNRAATVVLNSYQEGFGLALSEAMLCGAAVIGTRSGGIVDIIEHDKRGLLVEVDNVTELAEAILRMITKRPVREKLAEAGYRFAPLALCLGRSDLGLCRAHSRLSRHHPVVHPPHHALARFDLPLQEWDLSLYLYMGRAYREFYRSHN